MPDHCWQLKVSRRFSEVPGTSARYFLFTQRVEAVSPPCCGVRVLAANYTRDRWQIRSSSRGAREMQFQIGGQ